MCYGMHWEEYFCFARIANGSSAQGDRGLEEIWLQGHFFILLFDISYKYDLRGGIP